ncbi:DUF2637 domain-containing protein [Streptomyces sp. AcE210]|uniref:DUF2637 domain-containing protein n=1 Tax=Streptomyces sp. AcE210 TaxID=2292703 RepID=UPI001F0BA124|nr:DUF2637 domain-containing protein [Streptomyces sp. AcE210]
MAALQLTRTHRILIGVVVAGAVVIAGIGFAGSYAAVRSLALQKGFGNFSYVFPIGIDAGICVLLALDLLLTWIRIPFPLLRQTAWLLTAATIAFNGAAAWPDPLGVGMHAVIPILFVVSVEAARHAVGRIADITADKHMEGVRLTRWLLSPLPTFLLWRRMKLWELRSYEAVIKLEQERLVYQARLRSRFGRAWRRKAPVESLMPLRLARYGVPLAETAPSGLAAAGIEPALLPPAPAAPVPERVKAPARAVAQQEVPVAEVAEASPWFATPPQPASHDSGYASSALPEQFQSRTPQSHAPVGDGGGLRFLDAYRAWLQEFRVPPTASQFGDFLLHEYKISTGAGAPLSKEQLLPLLQRLEQMNLTTPVDSNQFWNEEHQAPAPDASGGEPDEEWAASFYRSAAERFAADQGYAPDAVELSAYLLEQYDVADQYGRPLAPEYLAPYVRAANREAEAAREAALGEQAAVNASRAEDAGRVAVQMLIPERKSRQAPAAEPAGEAPDAGSGALAEAEPGTAAPAEAKPSGIDLVEFHYRQLPPESQAKSAKALAPELAALSGYAEGTVRKYIGELRRRGSGEGTD